jgi:chloride channel protein, CIC family
LIVAKMVAFALTVSSGGSGGVFAPSLFVGAMLGGAAAILMHQMPAMFVVVGMAAVFGAAARVPVATMLMVTEMAGGYHLLVPAGLAVMLSYLLQVRLSCAFKYRSLYEGQVPGRSDSPAHYMDHIQIALRILGKGNLPMADELGHLDLLRLLRSRIRFDLPGGKQLSMGVVKSDSPISGKPLRQLYQKLGNDKFEVVAILRRDQVLLPHADTLLQPEDRVLLITTPAVQQQMEPYIAPAPQVQQASLQAPDFQKAA